MNGSAGVLLRWAFAVLFVVSFVVGHWLAIANQSEQLFDFESVSLILAFASFVAVGLLIASKRPDHPVGWLYAAVGMFAASAFVVGELVTYGATTNPGAVPGVGYINAFSSLLWSGSLGCIILALLLVPEGRLPGPRWRPIAWAVPLTVAMIAASEALQPGPVEHGVEQNPVGLKGAEGFLDTMAAVAGIVAILALLAALASILVRFRRSRGEERLQTKWFVYVIAFIVTTVLFNEFAGRLLPDVVENSLFAISIAGLPILTGIAILKYRLYDIDVIINKTLVYGALAAFITAIYVGIVVGIGTMVGAGDKPNLGLSLAATAIVAVAFQPVRGRLQHFANRLVYGQRLSPYEAVTEFSNRISTSLSFEEVLPRMAEAAAKGVGGTRAGVRMFLPGGAEQSAFWPSENPRTPEPPNLPTRSNLFDKTLKVIHQGETVGEISVAKEKGEQLNQGEDKLLKDLASQAGLAMRNLRLTAELQQKLIEQQESRKRIVEAQDAERRRMERDIHDGAQQQLVSLSVKLTLAKNLASKDPEKAGSMLDQIKAETEQVIESVRDLARGIFPPLLADRGLGEALKSHAGKTGAPVSIHDETDNQRFSPEVESAIYFTIREALQNASKHAPNISIEVSLSTAGEHLRFKVSDQGPGFDMGRIKAGLGLGNMRDRIEAIGGEFRIKSSPGRGTTVEGAIPVKTLEPLS